MTDFMMRFLLCNVFMCGIIGILCVAKRIFKKSLSSRMQYNIWFLLLALLAVPFIPIRFVGLPQIFLRLIDLRFSHSSPAGAGVEKAMGTIPSENTNWMDDFVVSVNSRTPSAAGSILLSIWIGGILVMILLVIQSYLRLRTLKKSALPLQNPDIRRLYQSCLDELNIKRESPVYSNAYLKSPVFTGLLKPCIYLPIHLISDYNKHTIRYMLLHELQHYKHRDSLVCFLMNLAGVIYWFNPLVWYALKEMRNDKEVACDTSVLEMMEEDSYVDYGNTLLLFAEKISLTPFPFTSGLGGNKKQIKRRIINIASYEKPSLKKSVKSITAFMLTAVLLLGLTPFISTYAADASYYQWKSSSGTISHAKSLAWLDLTSNFGEYEGSFVFYDLKNNSWGIHGRERAALRVSPNSTHKIYDALFGLEEGILTPEDSFLAWNGESYPYEAWNTDQTLPSAMKASVNWYFQAVDKQLGKSDIYTYIQKTGYGNENVSGDLSSYWLESSLKISAIEQVELLKKLHDNSFGFSSENINAVKDAIRLSSSDKGTLYGKTGTGRVNGQDVNGWFVGFIETVDNTYFFATNITADNGATGSAATDITMSILSAMNIWE